MRTLRLLAIGLLTGICWTSVSASLALAHGAVPSEGPTVANLALGWTFEPAVVLVLLAAAIGWLRLVARIDRAHPANPVPRRRTVAFLAGLAAVAVSLMSGINAYDTTLF
ncbi:MAG: cytochrome c oxidase assembly protein, partial [Chloroflexi bacterium]|nr:cytochrome c oxidase assembly protein [Chloroflexota bacterium]